MKPCCSRTLADFQAEVKDDVARRIAAAARVIARRLIPGMVIEALDALGVEAVPTEGHGVRVIGPKLPTEGREPSPEFD